MGEMTELLNGPVVRRIVAFSLPLTAANLLQQGYLLVDAIVVGRFVGVDGLAAVGASGPLFYLVNALFIGISTAFSIRLAHFKGAGKAGEISVTAVALGAFTTLWSVGTAVFVIFFAPLALSFMGIQGDVRTGAIRFLTILALGFPAIFGVGALSAFLRGLGDSLASMRMVGVSSILNALLAWLFVGPFEWGLEGAALATVLASSAGLVFGVLATRRKYAVTVIGDKNALRSEMSDALRLGFPLAIQHIALAVGIMILVKIIEPFGATALAAFAIVGRLETFTALIFLDFSGGLSAFVAQNLGAGQRERARRGLFRMVALTCGLTAVVSLFIVLARSQIVQLFTADAEVRELSATYISIVYPFFVLYTAVVVIHGFLNGAQRTAIPLYCTIVAFILVQVPAAFVLGHAFEVVGVMWAAVVGWAVALAFTIASTARLDALKTELKAGR